MITFYGIVDFKEGNVGDPFLGVACDGKVCSAGFVTGDIDDCFDLYWEEGDIENWKKLQEAEIEPISWKEACQRKLDWLKDKCGGKEFVEYPLNDEGAIIFDLPINELQEQINNPQY